jgi:hypothetical protein
MKKRLSVQEEEEFFRHLGFRLYSTVLRGRLLDHRRPLSAARDYLRVNQLKGMDREASEFLVDVAHVRQSGDFTLEDLFIKWGLVATWHPSDSPDGDNRAAEMNVRVAQSSRDARKAPR